MQKKGKCKLKLLSRSSEGNSPNRWNLRSLTMNNKGYKSNSAFLSTSPSSFHHQFGLFVDLFFCLLVLVGFFWGEVVYSLVFVVLFFSQEVREGSPNNWQSPWMFHWLKQDQHFNPVLSIPQIKPLCFYHTVRINNFFIFPINGSGMSRRLIIHLTETIMDQKRGYLGKDCESNISSAFLTTISIKALNKLAYFWSCFKFSYLKCLFKEKFSLRPIFKRTWMLSCSSQMNF